MFRTPSKPRGSPTQGPATPRKKGLFEDGQWLCDCTPRKPALYLRVKKEGPNKGKFFYTCDQRKCNFFLFEHDAQVREREALVHHNCRSENGIVARVQAKGEPPVTPSFGPRTTTTTIAPSSAPAQQQQQQRIFRGLPRRNSLSQDSEYLSYESEDERQSVGGGGGGGGGDGGHRPHEGTPSSSQTLRQSSGSKSSGSFAVAADRRMPDFSFQAQTPSATKRKRGIFLEDSDEEFGGDDFGDSDTERQLAAITDESARKQKLAATPSAQQTVDLGRNNGGIPTPVTRHSLLIAEEHMERSAKRLRFAAPGATVPAADEDAELKTRQFMSDANTPTPYRKTNALLFPPDGPDPTTPTTNAARATSLLFKTPTSSSAANTTECPKIADEIMALLAGQPISEATRRNVRAAAERHELRVKGLVKGRDTVRAALESRDERVAELQAKVVSLENARRLDRAQLREFSKGLVRLSQEEE